MSALQLLTLYLAGFAVTAGLFSIVMDRYGHLVGTPGHPSRRTVMFRAAWLAALWPGTVPLLVVAAAYQPLGRWIAGEDR